MEQKRKKTGGRQKGTPNKLTSETRKAVQDVVIRLLKGAEEDLAYLMPNERMKVLTALLPFVCPKMAEINQEVATIATDVGELRIGFDDEDEE